MVTRSSTAALLAACCVAAAPLAGCALEDEGFAEAAQHVTDSGRQPVIWVHGCPPPVMDHEEISHFTDEQRSHFLSRGYAEEELFRFVFSGAQCGSNIDIAAELSDYVDDILARPEFQDGKVDIVSHSMGATATRLYLAQGGDRNVDAYVSIAGVEHGTLVAVEGEPLQLTVGAPAYEGMKELYPPYACEGETAWGAADIQAVLNGCLTPEGSTDDVDETPGDVRYLSIRNSSDEDVQPVESSCLNQGFENDCSDPVNVEVTVPAGPGPCTPVGCPAHVTVLWDPGVMEMVYDHVTGP